MKICLLADRIPPEGLGGAENIAWSEALALRARGHEVMVITTTAHSDVEKKNVDDVVVVYVPVQYHVRWQAWRGVYNPPAIKLLKNILREYGPDAVHAHNVHTFLSYYALRVAKKNGARVTITCHDVMPFNYGKLMNTTPGDYRVSVWRQLREQTLRYNPFRNFFIRHILNRVDHLIVVSNALKEALAQNGIRNAVVVYNGIEAKQWEVSPEKILDFKKEYGVGQSAVLYVGRLSEAKGGVNLLRALQGIVARAPHVQLVVVGNRDAHTDVLLRMAQEHHLEEKLIFTGVLKGEELRAAYHSAQVVAVPSLCFDSFPTVILEAMACQRAVVASTFGGGVESVHEGVTGYVVNPHNVHILGERLADLLRDEDTSRRFGKAGYERVIIEFSLKKHIDTIERLL